MTIRGRLFLGAALLALLPLGLTGVAIRRDVGDRLDRQVRARADAQVATASHALDARRVALDAHLDAIVAAARDDSRLRLALVDGSDAAYVRDWAPKTQGLTGLDALLLLDDRGTILSSGAFRNDFGRLDAETPAFLGVCGPAAGVVSLRRPDGEFLALARSDSLALSGRTYRLVGGFALTGTTLAGLVPDPEVTAVLRLGDREVLGAGPAGTSNEGIERSIDLPARTSLAPAAATARITFTHSLTARRATLRALDRRLLLAFGLAAVAAVLLARVLAARLARPVEELAEKARTVDLDHLDVAFASDRQDEIGALSRFLDGMTRRLSSSVARLRESERRAALGDLARQVNHDLKNAFPPIRNVVKHLGEVADRPDELARVFAERRGTLDSGLTYLDELASNWKRLAGRTERQPCDVGAIVRESAAARTVQGNPVAVDVGVGLPTVHADATGLRRIVDNLLTNACESGAASVTVAVHADAGPPPAVRLTVEDDGPGIPAEARERIFEPYWTTKPGGTGLGLAIVRRLVSDAEGRIRLEDRDGRGTRVTVTLPAGGGT